MSVKDMIKKSVLESGAFTNYDVPGILTALAAALLLGALIYLVYRKFYAGVVFSRTFAVTLVGMTVLTCMVTLAISTNVVISLGMVGALSIVRFRTAIKDPMDLLYLFWAITTGITAGAGMYVLALLAAAIMILMIVLFYHKQQRGKIYIAVIHYTGDQAGDEVIRCFGKMPPPKGTARIAPAIPRRPTGMLSNPHDPYPSGLPPPAAEAPSVQTILAPAFRHG